MKKIKEKIKEYGRIVIMVYFGIFFLSFFIFWLALTFGFDIKSHPWFAGHVGDLGGFALAYAATKLIQPFRITLTLVLTPILAKYFPFLAKPKKKKEILDA